MTAPSDRSPMAPGAMFRRRWTPVTEADVKAERRETVRTLSSAHRPRQWRAWQINRIKRDLTAIRDTTERTPQ